MSRGQIFPQGKMKKADIAGRLIYQETGALLGEGENPARGCFGSVLIAGILPLQDKAAAARDRVLLRRGIGDRAGKLAALQREGEVADNPVAQSGVGLSRISSQRADSAAVRLMLH